jgi:hypothetical protein
MACEGFVWIEMHETTGWSSLCGPGSAQEEAAQAPRSFVGIVTFNVPRSDDGIVKAWKSFGNSRCRNSDVTSLLTLVHLVVVTALLELHPLESYHFT